MNSTASTISTIACSDLRQNTYEDIAKRYFRVASITVCLSYTSDLEDVGFRDKLLAFAVDGPGTDNISIRHHFEMPDLKDLDLGEIIHRVPPWEISISNETWCYKGILPDEEGEMYQLAFFSADHTRADIYNSEVQQEYLKADGFWSLSLFPTDQIWLGRVLTERNALLVHSAAAIINGRGFLFPGHSGAGKSTTIRLLQKAAEEQGLDVRILCDDRNIIRKWGDEWRVHGTWSHGDIAEISSSDARLCGIFFPEQSAANNVALLSDSRVILKNLIPRIIRPMITKDWWNKNMENLELLIQDVPCYSMRFDKSGAIIPELESLSI